MKWDDGLIIDGVEITEITDEPRDMFQQTMEALYELSYKYDQIDLHDFKPSDAKAVHLAAADAGIRDMARVVSSILIEVFDEWLEHHALTSARTWAIKRMPEDLDELEATWGDDKTHFLNSMISEFGVNMWYAAHPGSRSSPVGGLIRQYTSLFNKMVHQNASKMKALREIAKPIIEERYWLDMDDYENDELDEKPVKMDVDEWLDCNELSEVFTMIDWWQARDLAIDLYEHVVFPAWFARWKEQGIVSTRRRVEKAHARLKDINVKTMNYDIPRLSKDLNILINTAHQTGSMTDYIDNTNEFDGYTGSADFMKKLSDNPDTKIMDEELTEMGVLPKVDHSAVDRRRDRDAARKFVAAAWRDLAKRQRNPRISLQKAVLKRLRGK